VVADMTKASIDIAQTLAWLSAATIFELRGEWRRLHRMPPPMRLSRDLLTRGITYKLQEQAYGGLSTAATRRLAQASAGQVGRAAKPTPPTSLKSGTRLARRMARRHPYRAVYADGFEWNRRRYQSLTIVAREITGADWSGPRFLGLRKCAGRCVESAEGEHADA